VKDSEGNLQLKSFTVTQDNQEYKLYYLVIREGEGKKISKSDDFFISYEGSVIGNSSPNEEIQPKELVSIAANPFDTTNSQLRWLNGFRIDQSGRLAPSVVTGFYETLTKFRTAQSIDPNKPCQVMTTGLDGKVSISKPLSFGIGVMIIPSGLGFYNRSNEGVLPYSNLIFKFDIVNNQYNDNDRDGIDDINEGINEGKDSDGDRIQDYQDTDDDNDGVSTRDELVFIEDQDDIDADCDGVITNDIIINFLNKDYLNKNIKGKGGIIKLN